MALEIDEKEGVLFAFGGNAVEAVVVTDGTPIAQFAAFQNTLD